MSIPIYLERNPNFYPVNVVFVFFFRGCVYSMHRICILPRAMIKNKQLEVLLTILLTTVAHKIIVTSWLPVKPYQSRLDIFIICCFVFQLLVMVYLLCLNEAVCLEDRDVRRVSWASRLRAWSILRNGYIWFWQLFIMHLDLGPLFFHKRCWWLYEKCGRMTHVPPGRKESGAPETESWWLRGFWCCATVERGLGDSEEPEELTQLLWLIAVACRFDLHLGENLHRN